MPLRRTAHGHCSAIRGRWSYTRGRVARPSFWVAQLPCTYHRSAGSVFLSPQLDPSRAAALRARGTPLHDFSDGTTRVSSSWLIKDAGFTLGQYLAPGIRISSKQYTLVAEGPATSAAFAQAAELIATRVDRETGVLLRPELDLLGSEATYERLQGK